MNKEQEGLIELVGQEYTKWFYDNAVPSVSGKPILNGEGILTKGGFISKCKTNPEFSEKWGLKIEERELSVKERVDIFNSKMIKEGIRTQIATVGVDENYWKESLEQTKHDILTKLITITYNDKKI